MKSCIRLVTLVLGSLLHCAAGAAEPAASSKNTLWSIKGRDNTVYLLGSMHMLRATDTLPGAIDKAYKEAESLLMEIDMDDLDPMATQKTTLELGLLPEAKSLQAELDPATYAKVAAYAREVGLDERLLNRFRPWLAAMTLTQLNLAKIGFDPNSGVEMRLTARATADGKEIRGLETLDEQLGLLAGLPEAQQREFLLYTVEDSARVRQEIDKLVNAWRKGDLKALSALLSEGFTRHPELYRPLTTERNRKWIGRIEGLLDDKEDYLVVVGALHLVGRDSVVELLEKKGHKVLQQ
jgi:uncharacterized protein YbaP (TraB family)